MTAKPRTEVSPEISARVLFEQDHACCVCNMRGLAVQIHHIDGNPTNHDPSNLAVLCLDDHNRTLLKGGFGRQLTEAEVVLYRDDWVKRVKARREAATEIVRLAVAKLPESRDEKDLTPKTDAQIIGYLKSLPHIRRAAYTAARPRWDSGIGSEMRNAAYEVIDVLGQVLKRLSLFYPLGQFGLPAQEYFEAYIESRFHWYRSIYEPDGPGTGGTMLGEIVAGNVMSDLESLIEQVAEGLCFAFHLEALDLVEWRQEWTEAAN